MSALIEVFPKTPEKGKRYNAALATKVIWDVVRNYNRYFVESNDWRYMGTFVDGFRQIGNLYWEQYNCDGVMLVLNYDHKGTIFFEEVNDTVNPAPLSGVIVPIDKYITPLPDNSYKN